MTKDVLLSISGLHYDVAGVTEEDENEPIEVITPAAYYFKNGKHYVIYDEVVEGMPGTIKNKIRIAEDGKLEIMKSGLANTHMIFEKGKINMTEYETAVWRTSGGDPYKRNDGKVGGKNHRCPCEL